MSAARFNNHSSLFIFEHSTELACFSILTMIISDFIRTAMRYKHKPYRNIIPTVICVIASGRFKALGFLSLYIVLRSVIPLFKKFKWQYIVFFLPISYLLVADQIKYYLTLEQARGALIFTSFRIAIKNFPIGYGFSTFGTEFSRIRYSPLYTLYDIDKVYGLSRQFPAFIVDAMWPAILGENGFLGLVAIIFFFIEMLILIRTHITNKELFLITTLLLIYILFESLADTIFMSSRGVAIMFIISWMIAVYKRLELNSKEIYD